MAKPVVPPGQAKKIERNAKLHPRMIETFREQKIIEGVNANRKVVRSLLATVEAQQEALEAVHARLTALEAGGS